MGVNPLDFELFLSEVFGQPEPDDPPGDVLPCADETLTPSPPPAPPAHSGVPVLSRATVPMADLLTGLLGNICGISMQTNPSLLKALLRLDSRILSALHGILDTTPNLRLNNNLRKVGEILTIIVILYASYTEDDMKEDRLKTTLTAIITHNQLSKLHWVFHALIYCPAHFQDKHYITSLIDKRNDPLDSVLARPCTVPQDNIPWAVAYLGKHSPSLLTQHATMIVL